MIVNTEGTHGSAQLPEPVLPQLGATKMGKLGRNDLTTLTESAGDQRHQGALGRIPGHGRAIVDRLVVRMRMHQKQTPVGQFRHGATLRGPGDRPAAPS